MGVYITSGVLASFKKVNEENSFWREKLVWCELFKVAKYIISNKAAIIFH
ncbi:hypothetical protein [Tenacibaculum singaporense]